MAPPPPWSQGVYRNPMSEVAAFLEAKHKDRYMVINLCSERSYDPRNFQNRVKLFPFDDHNPPPLRMIPSLCQALQALAPRISPRALAVRGLSQCLSQ